MSSPFAELDIRVVQSPADVADFWEWLTRPGRTAVASDTETTGTNPFEHGFKCRLVQFGDGMSGWAIPFQDWRGLVFQTYDWLADQGIRCVWHNLAYDAKVLAVEGYRLRMAWQDDTYVWAGLVRRTEQSRALKTISTQLFGQWAAFGQVLLSKAFKNGEWDWSTVPIDFPPYCAYGVVDTILTFRLWEMWKDKRITYRWHHSLEVATIECTNLMAENGLGVDTEYALEASQSLKSELQPVLAELAESGVKGLDDNAKIGQVFKEAGVLPELVEMTESGLVSINKDLLGKLDHPVAEAVLHGRHLRKMSGYLTGMIKFADGQISPREIIHPEIRSIEARTGRMCLPTDQKILTDRGVLAWDDVKVGDRTIDRNGKWTTITAVHHYEDQEIERWSHKYMSLACTREHRWLLESERGVRRLAPLGDAVRRRILLAPPVGEDAFGAHEFIASTQEEVDATIIGLLVSDGRAHWEDKDQRGLRASIYQTERKFYHQIKKLLPPGLVSYELRPILLRNGIDIARGQLLKTSPDLLKWAITSSDRACRAFLRAVWLADGNIGHHRTISCGTPQLEEVLRIVGYRCGYSTRISISKMSEWGNKPRRSTNFARALYQTRHMSVEHDRSDVWCVSTEDQTFTAWDEKYGCYLTGNSIANPALQQLPAGDLVVRRAIVPRRDDEVLVGADFGQIELRMFGSITRDQALLDVLNQADAAKAAGDPAGDFFVMLGRSLFSPDFIKSDPRRGYLKATTYAKLYSGGLETIAKAAHVDVAVIAEIVSDLEAQFPSFRTLGSELVSKVGDEWQVFTPTGKRFAVAERGNVRKLMNYLVQGHSAEILKMALQNVVEAGYRDQLMLPVHDEIILSVHKDKAVQATADLIECMNAVVDPAVYGVAVRASASDPAPHWAAMSH